MRVEFLIRRGGFRQRLVYAELRGKSLVWGQHIRPGFTPTHYTYHANGLVHWKKAGPHGTEVWARWMMPSLKAFTGIAELQSGILSVPSVGRDQLASYRGGKKAIEFEVSGDSWPGDLLEYSFCVIQAGRQDAIEAYDAIFGRPFSRLAVTHTDPWLNLNVYLPENGENAQHRMDLHVRWWKLLPEAFLPTQPVT